MPGEGSDPTAIRSIAVTSEDLIAAVEANHTSGRRTVLRVTPPFSGRMRARLHVPQDQDDATDEPEPIHVEPDDLLAAGAPSVPRPDDTAVTLRSDPDTEYTVDRHRDRHVRAVEGWRRAARSSVVDTVVLRLPDGEREVDVTVLG